MMGVLEINFDQHSHEDLTEFRRRISLKVSIDHLFGDNPCHESDIRSSLVVAKAGEEVELGF